MARQAAKTVNRISLRNGLASEAQQLALPDPEAKPKRIYWTQDEYDRLAAETFRLRMLYPLRSFKGLVELAQQHVIKENRRRQLEGNALDPIKAGVMRCAEQARNWLNQRTKIEEEQSRTRNWRCLKTHLKEAPLVDLQSSIRIILDRIPIHELIEGLEPTEILSVTSLETLLVSTAKRFIDDYEGHQQQVNRQLDAIQDRLMHMELARGTNRNGKPPTDNGKPNESTKEFHILIYGVPDDFNLAIRKMLLPKVANHVQVKRVDSQDLNPQKITASTNLIGVWMQGCSKRQLSMIEQRVRKLGLPPNSLVMCNNRLADFVDALLPLCPQKEPKS